MLKVYGNCSSCWSLDESNLARLYAGACCQFITGRIGISGLWILSRPRIFGGCGFILEYFHFRWSGMSSLHVLMIFFVSREWKAVGSLDS